MTRDYYIVGIGASAGSLPAMIEFFKQIPAGTNAAFVVVSHLMRGHRSRLDHILQGHSAFPVVRVESDTAVQPGHIYVMPENIYLSIEQNVLRVSERGPGMINHAVDVFLHALASNAGDAAVAVILSGGGKDGLSATEAIHRAGGKVFVQEPESATHQGMPLSVIEGDHPDQIREPAALAKELLKLVDRQNTSNSKGRHVF